MKILFLDIDGVLNRHQPIDPAVDSATIDKDLVVILNRILATTNCRLVIVSAWRYLIHNGSMTQRGFGHLLQSHGIRKDHFHGLTRMDYIDPKTTRPYECQRGDQVREWLEYNTKWTVINSRNVSFAILDDLDLGYSVAKSSGEWLPELRESFFKVDGTVGLTDEIADKVIKHLLRNSDTETECEVIKTLLVGLTLEEAQAKMAPHRQVRAVMKNGRPVFVTRDYDPKRIGVILVDGIIVDVNKNFG